MSGPGEPLAFLETKLMRYFGTISYAVYLYHLIPVLWFENSGLRIRWTASLTFAVTLMLATASLYCIEAPARHWKDHVLNRMRDTMKAKAASSSS